MRISVDASDLGRMAADVRALSTRVPFATVVALTRTAVAIKAAEQDEMRSKFDRPTPFTLNALYVKAASKSIPTASVGIKDGSEAGRSVPPNKYLAAEIEGGERRRKSLEVALQRNGLMPQGTFVVPGPDARLDAYGNVVRSQVTQILSQLRITDTRGKIRNLRQGDDKKSVALRSASYRRAGGQYFVLLARRGRLFPGIYQRPGDAPHGRGLLSIFRFVSSEQYRQRFEFEPVALRTAEVAFPAIFDQAAVEFAK